MNLTPRQNGRHIAGDILNEFSLIGIAAFWLRLHRNLLLFAPVSWYNMFTGISLLYTWWRHQMETFFALLALCAGNSPVPVTSQHKRQWRGGLMFSLICASINDWVNNRRAGDLRRHCGHYDVSVKKKVARLRTHFSRPYEWDIAELFYCYRFCWSLYLHIS